VFTRIATYKLEIYPPISGDESWIMSVAYKLTTQGVFGSDLYAGLFNAERHYFIAPPVHHFLEAISFLVAGPGVAQVRWVSLISGLVVLWVATWLAYRWYGLLPALLTGLLLVFWRSHWAELRTGVPLFDGARSGRYDLSAVAWAWVSIGLLDSVLRRPRRGAAFALGICAGLATLTQFFGAFILPLVAGVWLWRRRRQALSDPISVWILLGSAVVLLPYLLYAAYYSTDLIEQTAWFKADRVQFASLAFYIENISTEPRRYSMLIRWSHLGSWLLIAGVGARLLSIYRRSIQKIRSREQILWPSVLVFAGLLTLVDHTKALLYALILLPSLCIIVAVSIADVLAWGWARQHLLARLLIAVLGTALLAAIAVEGVSAELTSQRQAAPGNPYLELGERLSAHLPPNSTVLGTDRFWWALHEHPYRSIHGFFNTGRAYTSVGRSEPAFAAWVAQQHIDVILLNADMRDTVAHYPVSVRSQVLDFIRICSVPIAAENDATYGHIEIHQIVPSAEAACHS
jgi:4-amino-4-deoxy-L-arabinose transferase-like glycosyltransferase